MTNEAHKKSFLINWADGSGAFWWLAGLSGSGEQRVIRAGPEGQDCVARELQPLQPRLSHTAGVAECCSTPLLTESEPEGTSDVLDSVWTGEGQSPARK